MLFSLFDSQSDLPEPLHFLRRKQLQSAKAKYEPELRRFALALYFYSTKAYSFVRKQFRNLLPHPATIRKWSCNTDCKPGFNKDAFASVEKLGHKLQKRMVCNLVFDEMNIKHHTTRKHGRRFGYVDLGINNYLVITGEAEESLVKAHKALVFLLVSLNGRFKVPIAYFMVNAINGQARANLLKICFHLAQQYSIDIYSLTYDGEPSNTTTVKSLGIRLDFGSAYTPPKLHFSNPATNEPVWIIPDPCHMLKNIRNCLGDYGTLVDGEGKLICWSHIVALHELQEKEGLTAGTKLTERHIQYEESKMNVKIATQTISRSVAEGLEYAESCKAVLKKDHINDVSGTATYCRYFNDAFDALNCMFRFNNNELKNPYKLPLEEKTEGYLQNFALEMIAYIKGLRKMDGMLLIHSRRKTGFIGFIVCLTNIFEMFEYLKEKCNFEYILTYKLLQDLLETFFSAVRMKGGYCNNPTAYQFQYAVRQLLIHQQIMHSYNDPNCELDDIPILYESSTGIKEVSKDEMYPDE